MPTYDYQCQACGHEFEKFQSITADPIKKCPVCHARRVRRLIGAGGGIIFRGSGFYQTDYRSESYKNAAKAEADAATGKSDGKAKPGKSKDAAGESKKSADHSAGKGNPSS